LSGVRVRVVTEGVNVGVVGEVRTWVGWVGRKWRVKEVCSSAHHWHRGVGGPTRGCRNATCARRAPVGGLRRGGLGAGGGGGEIF